VTDLEFRQRLDDLGVSLEDMARITGIKRRTLMSYYYGERVIPSWMPFLLTGLRLYLLYGEKK
jgi:transcriptional regulator with XRE-family HTH domain